MAEKNPNEAVYTLERVSNDLSDPRKGLIKDKKVVPCPFQSQIMPGGQQVVVPCTSACLHMNLVNAIMEEGAPEQVCAAITCGSGIMIPIANMKVSDLNVVKD